ncbi:MAG: serine/threonine-protein kinase [Acidobacteriota bacterium]
MKYCVHCERKYSDELALCSVDGYPLLNDAGAGKTDPLIGTLILEKYRIDRLLGRGGMGAVYEGKHLLLDRAIAIKVMHPQIVVDENAVARFIREAKTSAKLDHPNAVTIYDFGVLENGAFIVMEFISGKSLRTVLSNGALTVEQALEWFTPICAAVDAAHRRDIIHRDLKPENIMLKETAEGVIVKVVDFGLAKLSTSESDSVKLTKSGQVLGTPQYMAPELFDGEDADPRSDIYALGIIFYEMVTGSVPFSGSLETVIAGHLLKEPTSITKVNPAIKIPLDETLKLALNKRRNRRIGSAMEFATALKAAVANCTNASVTTPTIKAPSLASMPTLAHEDNLIDKPVSQRQSRSTEPFISQSTNNLNDVEQPTTAIDQATTLIDNVKLSSSALLPTEPSTIAALPPPADYTTLKATVFVPTRVASNKPSRMPWLVLAAVVVLAVGGTVVYFGFQRENPQITPTQKMLPAYVPPAQPPTTAVETAPVQPNRNTNTNTNRSNRRPTQSARDSQPYRTEDSSSRSQTPSSKEPEPPSKRTPKDKATEIFEIIDQGIQAVEGIHGKKKREKDRNNRSNQDND